MQPAAPRWFDRAQGYFSERACGPAVWFDHFFGDPREDDVASALLQVAPGIVYSDRDRLEHDLGFRGRVKLPNLSHRLSLVFDDQADDEGSRLPDQKDHEQAVSPARERTSAALRYLVRLKDLSRADFDLGLRAQARVFARARYMKNWNLAPFWHTRFTQSFFFRDGDGWGESSLGELEYALADDMLLRFGSQLTAQEKTDGLRLREGLHLLHQIDRDRAVNYGAVVLLTEEPYWRDASYTLSMRYRQRVFRPWLFVEAEPFVDWSRDYRFNDNPGIVLRVEFWFGDVPTPEATRGGAPEVPVSGAAMPPEQAAGAGADAPPVTNPTSDDRPTGVP